MNFASAGPWASSRALTRWATLQPESVTFTFAAASLTKGSGGPAPCRPQTQPQAPPVLPPHAASPTRAMAMRTRILGCAILPVDLLFLRRRPKFRCALYTRLHHGEQPPTGRL